MAYIGVQGEDTAAYSSRNAVSFAFAAVFLTAANALGSSNAMRASFIVLVGTCAIAEAGHHAAAARRARDRRRLESASCSQAAKARIFIAEFVQQRHDTIVEGVSSRCLVQSMCFRVVFGAK